jgi:hypothetical protein
MKKFIGYYIIGASSQEEASNEKGLLLWSVKKPNAIVRFFNRVFLGLYWVNKVKFFEERGKTAQSSESGATIEMQKLVPEKIIKKTDGRSTKPKTTVK